MTPRGFVVGDRILGQSADSHADWCAGYGRIGAYRFVGASAIGKSHLRDALPRDDAFAVRSAGVWLAIAVSDGAGSRKLSRYGASFAVEALCEHLLREATGTAPTPETESAEPPIKADENDKPTQVEPVAQLPAFDAPLPVTPSDEAATAYGTLTWHWQPPPPSSAPSPLVGEGWGEGECVRRAFQRTRQGLEQFAHSRNMALRELHCTLLGLLLNTETGEVAVGHVGDGLVAAFHPEFGAKPLVDALTPGEVGETYVLTQNDWEKYLVVRALSPQEAQGITTFYLLTDGVADDCTHPPPEDIFQRWAKDIDREVRKDEPLPQTATRLLRWLATYEVRGSWDDRTLVVALRDAE